MAKTLHVDLTPVNPSGFDPSIEEELIESISKLDVSVWSDGFNIDSCTIMLDGVRYNSSIAQIDIPVGMRGTQILGVSVVSDEGEMFTREQTITVRPYAAPILNDVEVYRPDESDNAVQLKLNATISSINLQNDYTCAFEIGEDVVYINLVYTGSDIYLTENHYTYDNIVTGVAAEPSLPYKITITLKDKTGNSFVLEKSLPSILIPFELGEGGTSVGIGRHADTSDPLTIKVGWDTYLDQGLSIKRLLYEAIASGTDLDDVFDFGYYKGNGSLLTHSPTDSTFTMRIVSLFGLDLGGPIMQEIVDGYGNIHRRIGREAETPTLSYEWESWYTSYHGYQDVYSGLTEDRSSKSGVSHTMTVKDGFCHLEYTFTNSVTFNVGTSYTLGTLAAKYRPRVSQTLIGNTNGQQLFIVYVQSGGSVLFRAVQGSNLSTGTERTIKVSWPI